MVRGARDGPIGAASMQSTLHNNTDGRGRRTLTLMNEKLTVRYEVARRIRSTISIVSVF